MKEVRIKPRWPTGRIRNVKNKSIKKKDRNKYLKIGESPQKVIYIFVLICRLNGNNKRKVN